MDDDKKPVAASVMRDRPGIWQLFSAPYIRAVAVIKKDKKRYAIGLVAFVLVAAVIGGLLWWNHRQTVRNQHLAYMSSFVDGLAPAQKAQYYSDQGEYKIAEKIWQDELSKTTDTPTKLSLYFLQSALAVKFKNYNDAKKYATEALVLSPKSSTPYVSLAQMAQAQGDKAAARQYWQQAINLIDPNDPAANLIKIDYQYNLDKLK